MNRNNILEPLLHILVLVILFGFPYTFVNSLDSVNWKMVANRVAVPVALCIVFYADYFLLVPKLLFKGRTGLWFQINIVLVLLTGVAMRLWQWYILPGDPGSHLPPGPEIIPRDSFIRTTLFIFLRIHKNKIYHCCPEKFYHKVGCSTEAASGTLTGVVG